MPLGDWPVTGVTQPTVYRNDVPTSATSLTTTTVWLSLIWLSNSTGSQISFTLTHTDGTVIRKNIQIEPESDYSESVPFLQCVGLKWSASVSGLKGQLQVN